MLQIIGNVYYF